MAIKCPKCQSHNPETASFCADCGTQLLPSKKIPVTETLETPKEELTRGTTLANRYEIIEELGKGGMGRVYRVEDTKLKQEVALKLIKPEIAKDKKTIERFRNELKLARNIRQKNVCGMFDLGEAEGAHFITMEYVSGQDLKGLVRQTGQLAVGTTIHIAKQVCEGLSEAHELGIVHRDLKPSNIMIDKEGNARIMDFGIARSIEGKGITGAGVMIGTPEYMSPEQVEGKEVDRRSDIYSLGVILYEMITGRVPFEGDTPFTIGMKHKGEEPKNPKELNTQIPDDLSRVIMRCLEKEKDKRYQRAGEVRSELVNIEKGIPTTERVVPERKPLTSREITVTFGLKKLFIPALVFIGIVITGVVIWQLLPEKEAVLAPKIENSIAVISFKNQTGDTGYDYLQEAIPNLLITNLENTGHLYVATWERMHDLLKQMGKEDVEIINRDLGFELCRREGIEAIVLGSFIKAEDIYATDVKVLDVETKKLLKSASSKGKGVDSILESQIDILSSEIIQGIGIAKQKIESSQLQIMEVTTNSIEAYNHFLKGSEAYSKFYYEDARKLFERTVALDPTFAMAYYYLAFSYSGLGNIKARNEALEKALSFSKKTTEKERLYIEAAYARWIERNQEKRFQILQRLVERYPKEKRAHFRLGYFCQSRDPDKAIEEYNKALELDPDFRIVLNQLGYTYAGMENYEKAVEYFERYVSVSPGDANPLDSLADTYYLMGKLDDAISKFKEALEIKPDFYSTYAKIGYLYALKEDYVETLEWINKFIAMAPSPGTKREGYLWKGFYSCWLGILKSSLIDLQRAEELAEVVGDESGKIYGEWLKGFFYYDRGEFELSRKYYESWLDFCLENYPRNRALYKAGYSLNLGLIDIKEGQIDSAKIRLADLKSNFPELTPRQKEIFTYYYNLLDAEVLLAEDFPERAITAFEKASLPRSPLPQYTEMMISYNTPFRKDVIARAYQQNEEIDKAIAEYERLISFDPDSNERRLIHPKCNYRLAKLYEQKGWKSKAIENYEKFLSLWKDADPGIAEVEDAKKRLAGLKKP